MILNVWMSYSSSRKDDSTEDAQKQGGDQWNEPDSWGKTTSPAAAECEFAPRRTKRERHLKSANSSTSQCEKKCRSLRHSFECYRGCLVRPNDQRLSAALTNPAKVKAFNAADEPRWTEPLLVTETAVAV